VPLDELWKSGEGNLLFNSLMRLQHLALLIAPRLFGFQWVLMARQVKPDHALAPQSPGEQA
jgi:hypothetical protein